jgi:DDE superfamily endonuclease
MICQTQRWLPKRDLVVVADSAFSALEWLQALAQRGITVVTRLRLEAALYEPAPFRPPRTNGRPRKKGKRLATLRHVLNNPTTSWQRLRVPSWYGEGDRVIEVCTQTAVWYHTGLPPVPLRWVLIRDPQQCFDPQGLALYGSHPEPAHDGALVRAALASRSNLSGSTQEPRGGNPATMDPTSHCPDDAVFAGTVFCGDLTRRSARPPR